MKKSIYFLPLLFFLNTHLLAQERGYGEKNGYDWINYYESAKQLYSLVEWENKQEWIDNDARTRKMCYLRGIFDLCTRMPTDCYSKWKNPNGKTEYIQRADAYPYLYGTTPDQILKGLDKFYTDYKNMNIKILDAINICQMEIKGESQDDIDWKTRYFRADDEGKQKLIDERFSKKKQ